MSSTCTRMVSTPTYPSSSPLTRAVTASAAMAQSVNVLSKSALESADAVLMVSSGPTRRCWSDCLSAVVSKSFQARRDACARSSVVSDSGRKVATSTKLRAESAAPAHAGAVSEMPESRPPAAGPMTKPMPNAAPIMPSALPRSFSSVTSEM
jgi:hypothetical protein